MLRSRKVPSPSLLDHSRKMTFAVEHDVACLLEPRRRRRRAVAFSAHVEPGQNIFHRKSPASPRPKTPGLILYLVSFSDFCDAPNGPERRVLVVVYIT